ncbi:hypothetical protein CLOM_g7782 [Closterium sp. NIES-68]|nr:hypothetical protein CLOM_g7782 [Closterium sp. NIES-68]
MNERGGDANGRGAVAEKASEPPPSKVEALDGSNYEEWSGRMRSAFKRYKLLKIAVGEEKMPEEGEARERWIEKSAVLFDLILQSVNKEMFEHIKDLVEADDSGPRAWKLLRDVVQPNTLPMVIVLEKELAAISMRPGDDVKPVLDKIKDTYARMAAAGSSVSQLQQCTKIISVLDNSWDNLIPTLNSQQDQWTPEWLRQQILQEDFRRRHVGGGAATKTAEGYGAAGRGKGRGGWRGRGRGRSFGRGRGRGDYNEGHGSSSGRGSTRMEGTCWYCKKIGHPWFKCFSRPEGWAPPGMKPPSGERAQGGAVQGSGAQGGGAQGNAYPGLFLMVEDVHGHEGDVGSVGKVVMHPLTHWVIDSGCTSHMTPRADLLDEVKPPGKIKYVATASGALLPVIGVGNAKVKGANGELVGLGNVLLVEGLSANLLSVRRLQKSKAEVTFGPTSCPTAAAAKATAGGDATAPTDGVLEAVKKVQQQQTHSEVLAGVDASAAWAKASSRSGEADWETWHERLCHVNFPMLQKLVKDGSLKGLEVKGGVKEIGSCPTCLETKFSKFPFNSTTGPAKTPLALVHMDVVGPTRAPSLSGSRYFLTIIEEDEIAHCYWAPIPEPKTREEALNGPNGEKWKASEDEEFGSLIENETWDLCDLPPGKKAITSKMIYRHKYGPEGELTRYKSRLVARGFQQTKGKDYDEVFAPVGKGTTLRVLLAIAALLGWKIRQMDIRKYCEGLAEKYGLQDGGKPATPLPSGFTVEPCADEEVVGESDRKLFHSMVGSLNYAANHTRPDIAFATSRLASVVSRPSHEQLEAAKRLVRYVSATASVGLEYSGVRQRLQRGATDVKSGEMLLSCYTDASFNSVKADGTSIGGLCVLARRWCCELAQQEAE